MDEWVEKRLADVVELRRGFDLPTRLRKHGPYPVLSSGLTAGWHDEGPIKGPGFVIGRATNLGEPTWSESDFWPLNTTLYAADFKGNHPRFLFHLFEGLDLSGFDSGSVQPMLNRNYIADVRVNVPPIEVQASIAEVLGALDEKIAANDRTVEKVSELSAASFARAMANTGGKVTTISSLSAAGEVTFGDGYRTKKSELSASGFSIIRAADVQGGVVRLHGEDFVSTDFSRQIGAKAARAGDIVVTTKGTVGRVAVVPELSASAVYSPQCCYFRLADSSTLSWGFLAGWVLSRGFNQQLESLMHKSDMAPYVNLKDVGSLTLLVPDEAIQQRIDAEQRSLLGHAQQLTAENIALARTRDELLPLLMSGKLTVNSAEDRASDLL